MVRNAARETRTAFLHACATHHHVDAVDNAERKKVLNPARDQRLASCEKQGLRRVMGGCKSTALASPGHAMRGNEDSKAEREREKGAKAARQQEQGSKTRERVE